MRAVWYVPTAVYRAYSMMHALLYVGISNYPEGRLKAHKHTAEWALEFSHATCEWFDDRFLAAGAETRAIRAEHPAFNAAAAVCRCGRANLCVVCAYSGPEWHPGFDRWAHWPAPIPHLCPATFMREAGGTRIIQMEYLESAADDMCLAKM
ncbi:MAG TPA: hypothetical protein VFQ68_45690 [Streptosporangiaceae bacterium]|nr:hypothetical protein [Streptosporangiaceae bacterium]